MEKTAEPILVGHIAHAPILECPPGTSVSEAIARMRLAGRGSILVVQNDEPIGIVTVDDILRLDFDQKGFLAQPISQVMSAPVKTIRKDAAMREAAFRFRKEHFRHLLVVDAAGNRVGVVSQTDVINNQGIEFFVHLRDVRSAMHPDVIIVPAATVAVDVFRLLRECRQDAVVVEDDGQYGVYTTTDLLATIAERAFRSPIGKLAHFPLQSVSPDASLFQARAVFVERGIRHLGVREGDRLIGLMTYGDIMECVEQVYLRDIYQSLEEHSGRLLLGQQALALAGAVAEASLQGVVITDAAGIIESVNPAFTTITGYGRAEAVGKNMRLLRSGRHDSAFFRDMFATLAERGTWSGEVWNKRKDGELYPELLTVTAVRGVDGAIGNYVGVFSSIADQKLEQARLLEGAPRLEHQESLYRIILDTLPINVFVKDEEQRYIMVNDHAAAFFGLRKDQVRGRTDSDLFPSPVAERLRGSDRAVVAEQKRVIEEDVVPLRGTEFYLLAHKRGVEVGGNRLLIGASIDITSRRIAERRLADERRVLELIAGNAGQGEILETICKSVERYLHGAFVSVLVLDNERSHLRLGASPSLPDAYVASLDGLPASPEAGSEGAAADSAMPVLVEDIHEDNRWATRRDLTDLHSLRACWSMPVLSSEREVLGTFSAYFRSPRRPTDLDLDLLEQGTRLTAIAIERARASAQLHRMATIDTLTGLPNRQHFFGMAQRELARQQRSSAPLAAFMLDIDHFKQINDSHGHAAGDEVLRTVAARIGASLRGTDVVGRLGGEEFAVLLPDTDEATAVLVAERLRKRIGGTQTAFGEGKSGTVTVSIGVALFRQRDDLDHLLSRADEALYAAKNGGRNQVRSSD